MSQSSGFLHIRVINDVVIWIRNRAVYVHITSPWTDQGKPNKETIADEACQGLFSSDFSL